MKLNWFKPVKKWGTKNYENNLKQLLAVEEINKTSGRSFVEIRP